MKKKALALAVASALIAPSAFAASDTSGMQYTSASEGFYGSLRAQYHTANSEGKGADIEGGSSRIGVAGTADLGGGLTGFYGWELEVGLDDGNADGKGLRTRLGNVGLRGDFGEVVFGSFWTFDYSATHGATDVANVHSGYFTYSQPREARSQRSAQYTTPDFNGFQSALLFKFDDNAVPAADAKTNPTIAAVTAEKDENDLDSWNLAASYAVQGFTLGASYNVQPDALTKNTYIGNVTNPLAISTAETVATTSKADAKSWTIRGSYAQDNWNVSGWYGSDNTSDGGSTAPVEGTLPTASGSQTGNLGRLATTLEDSTILAFSAGVAVDKVNLYAIHEINSDVAGKSNENTYTTLGVQYNLGAKSRTWLEYVAQDYDTNSNLEDYVNIGLRFDF